MEAIGLHFGTFFEGAVFDDGFLRSKVDRRIHNEATFWCPGLPRETLTKVKDLQLRTGIRV